MVEYVRNLSCDGCGKLLANGGSYSPVFDLEGRPIDIRSEEDPLDDVTADFEMMCDCGVNREFHSPEDARRTTLPASDYVKSPPVYRLF